MHGVRLLPLGGIGFESEKSSRPVSGLSLDVSAWDRFSPLPGRYTIEFDGAPPGLRARGSGPRVAEDRGGCRIQLSFHSEQENTMIGPTELIILFLMLPMLLVPVAVLILVALIYIKVRTIEQKLLEKAPEK